MRADYDYRRGLAGQDADYVRRQPKLYWLLGEISLRASRLRKPAANDVFTSLIIRRERFQTFLDYGARLQAEVSLPQVLRGSARDEGTVQDQSDDPPAILLAARNPVRLHAAERNTSIVWFAFDPRRRIERHDLFFLL